MWGCLLIAAGVCAAQVSGNALWIALCMGGFVALGIGAAAKGFALPVLLFFLPWSTVLKLAPDTVSFYTITTVAICAVYLLKNGCRLSVYSLVATLLLLFMTLLSKTMDGSGVALSYLMFFYLLVCFPSVTRELESGVDLRLLTLFFSVGSVTAALSARAVMGVDTIARYIDVYHWSEVTRYAGYYGDPNFYAAHISAAISGLLLLILYEKKPGDLLLYAALVLLLLYCGLLSASKTFVLTLAVVMALWLLRVLTVRRRGRFKAAVLVSIAVIVLFVGISGLFSDAWRVILFRFGQTTDLSSLTTGRIERWSAYLQLLATDVKVLFLGKGFTAVTWDGTAAHNTVLQTLFQFGILGSAPLIGWLLCYVRGICPREKAKTARFPTLLLLVGACLPWMALDMLFFDEFFLITLYVAAGARYVACLSEERNDLMEHNTRTISLKELWTLFVRRLWILLLAALCGMAGFFTVDHLLIKPQYASTATLYILRQTEENATAGELSADLDSALNVVEDCAYLLKSHAVLDAVCAEQRMDYAVLADSLSVENPTGTRILEVTVTADTPERAKTVVDCVCTAAVDRIHQTLGFEQVRLYEAGVLNDTPCNRAGVVQILLVGVAMAALVYGVFLLRFLPGRKAATSHLLHPKAEQVR
ncbi:MAG: hypothetical protein IJZ13_04160 [Clostridia bacterium]|nr:hypothetical protein [Clostridia bacterium]